MAPGIEILIIAGIRAFLMGVENLTEKARNEKRDLTEEEKKAIESGNLSELQKLHSWTDTLAKGDDQPK